MENPEANATKSLENLAHNSITQKMRVRVPWKMSPALLYYLFAIGDL